MISAGVVEPARLKPLFAAVHEVPLFVVLKTPLKLPAYNVVGVTGSMTNPVMLNVPKPVLMAVQDCPLLVLLKTPESLVAT